MFPKKLTAVLAVMALVWSIRARAQDVTITALEWIGPGEIPDQLPVGTFSLRPDFPSDLRNTPDPGYVRVQVFTDEKGDELGYNLLGTLPAYELAARDAKTNWKHKPARRDGKPVTGRSQCMMIFNSASADPQKADATARLLDAKIVTDPARRAAKGEPRFPPEVVWATVQLDEQGHPTAIRHAPPATAKLLEASLAHWKFAPARRAGHAVASDLLVPFIIVGPEADDEGIFVLPRVTYRKEPEYPSDMAVTGLRGEVLVKLVVDAKGQPTKAFVARSLNAAFDESALEAVREWKFEPGTRNGVPTDMPMWLTIIFRLPYTRGGGRTGIEVTKPADQSMLPPEFRYDVAPKPRASVRAVYPYEDLFAKVEGKARVNFAVDANGDVIFAKVESATRPEFGAALRAAMECFEFEPALKGDRPTQALLSTEQSFSVFSNGGLVTSADRELIDIERKHPDWILPAQQVDTKLKPISQRPPVFPLLLDGVIAKGEAVVEILIDKKGHARLARIVSASDPAFGWAAVQAASVWLFEPPKVGGKPAVVRVRIPFKFNGRTPAPK